MMHLVRALRPHQWVKNVFVFAALIFSQRLTHLDSVIQSLLIFMAFSAVASAIYLINDVADYERDRLHPKKKHRPIAAGQLSRRAALIASAALAPLGLILGWRLSATAGATLLFYAVMNLAYSFRLKHVVLLDVFIIALGFLLRVSVGAFAIGVGLSPWLLICTFFIALFLAFCKRRHELVSLGEAAADHRGILGEYSVAFIDKMISALAAMTVMSYALYTIDPVVMARLHTDALILTVPLVLFGVFRYLYLVHQHQMGGSPTEIVLKDRSIQAIVGLYLLMILPFIYFGVRLGLAARG
ncbi:decaprenyl-phosphate phosphoribosyltransferase [Myxococcota bacterium]|nr:decaprenyl-phosphate phosphoribosyltransferase [Myxococcota bacterium]MBU1430354.1 decaprenyl-phosphate phosphoribosyltransferase [Myxococcota bacterium]MBU1898184.1 decaprenyl-phosphate phosphoribosyltransferase [Myxococcota bacterium]